MPEHDVSLGRNAARQLKMLLPLVRGDRKQENRNLFDSVEARPPELEDQMWGTLAFVGASTPVHGQAGNVARTTLDPVGRYSLGDSIESELGRKCCGRGRGRWLALVKMVAGEEVFVQKSPQLCHDRSTS